MLHHQPERKVVLHKMIEQEFGIKIIRDEPNHNAELHGHHSEMVKLTLFLNKRGEIQ